MATPRILLIGIGNDLRGDDGLGWAFVDAVANSRLFEGSVHHRYQLQAEDAALLREAEHVFFIDAAVGKPDPGFDMVAVEPQAAFEFTTHALAPGALLHVCRSLYGRCPGATLVQISGRHWRLGDRLSAHATTGLGQALDAFPSALQRAARTLVAAAGGSGPG